MAGLLDPSILQFLSSPGLANPSGSPTATQPGGLLGVLGSDEARLGISLLAAGGPSATPMNFGQRLQQAGEAYDAGSSRNLLRQQQQLGSLKAGLDVQGLIDNRRQKQSIQDGLKKIGEEEQAQAPRGASRSYMDDRPAMDINGAMPPPGGSTMPAGGQAALGVQLGSSRGNYSQGLSNRFVKQAEVYAVNGDFERANKLYEQAAKWMPEVHKIEVAMHQGQPVNVITMKDGNQVLSPFSPTPKVHWADTGGDIRAINEYTMGEQGRFGKTMTPGEQASNKVAWANNRNSTDRLNWDRSQANKPQFHDGNWHVPPSSGNPQGVVIAPQMPPGTTPKLTEVQANATQFATRMRDAGGVIEKMENGGAPWASTVARAGYDPQFPNWMPGGQVASGAARGLNNATVPEDAQRYYQAQTNWVTANLRKESGAAIGKDEMTQEIRKWFPQPGDGADVIGQKTAARRVAEEGMLVQAGPGAKQVDSILGRAGKGADSKTSQMQALDLPNGMNVKELKHGGVYRLPGGRVGKYDSMSRRFTEQ